ncbi:TMV resistance protein N [Arachis hypogaea]|nr:TMV resistance protein N [Arachis hypogaea]
MALSVVASSSSSYSQISVTRQYDVFISFRGEDTRNSFTSHLHSALRRNQIETFIDYRIQKGGAIWNELVEAIRDSNLFLVIFSENYASSKWCLRELVEIMECKKKNENVIVIPVFYRIEPTHVRKQTGSYQKVFAEHQRSTDRKEVQQWRTALTEAANLSGFHCDYHRQEAELIDEIVKAIFSNLNNNCYRDELKSPFICNRNYTSVKSLLKFKSENVLDVYGVESMIVDMNQITIDPHVVIIALRKMPKLKLLALKGDINMDIEWKLPEDFQLPNDLRYIKWKKCPLKFVPSICWPQKLVQLSMPGSSVQKLWDTIQNIPRLETIDLSGCKNLIECPNLEGAVNLKSIMLYECGSLLDVHPSIFSLPKIKKLDVSYCKALKRLCSEYCSPSLRCLWASDCSKLQEFSVSLVSNLDWFGFNISYSLEKLSQNFAHKIVLMDPIKHEDDTCIILSKILASPAFLFVKRLYFYKCKSLSKLPDNIHVLQTLQVLAVEICNVITSLPESIKNLQQLIHLYITDCEMLQYVPPFPPSIIYFCVINCKYLETVSSLTSEPPMKHKALFGLHNCTKLDDHAYAAVLKDLKSRIELVASDGYRNNGANNGNISFYYLPSKESILNDWFPHYYSTEASIIVEVPSDHNISSCLVVCMLISQYQSCNIGKKEVIFGCECYLEKGCNKWEWIATSHSRASLSICFDPFIRLEMVSDHKAVWYDAEYSNKIMEAIKERKKDTTCNPILKFELSAETVDNEEVVINGCGSVGCM